MTLSDGVRFAEMDRALARTLEDTREGAFDSMRCEPESERFRDIPQTTWLEMESLGYVRAAHAIGSPGYVLTGEGWIAALRGLGALESDDLRARAVALRAALKDLVKGRPLNGVVTNYHELAARTGLPFEWIANALRARLLQRLWPGDHLDIAMEHRGRVIRVPARFGAKRLLYEAGPFPDP